MTERETMTDYQFMRIYRTPYWHNPILKARRDAIELPRYGPLYRRPNTLGPQTRVEAEKQRRGLTYPDSWIAAGLDPHK